MVCNTYIVKFIKNVACFYLIRRGTSSHGRALALHARGTGIDARVLQASFVDRPSMVVHSATKESPFLDSVL